MDVCSLRCVPRRTRDAPDLACDTVWLMYRSGGSGVAAQRETTVSQEAATGDGGRSAGGDVQRRSALTQAQEELFSQLQQSQQLLQDIPQQLPNPSTAATHKPAAGSRRPLPGPASGFSEMEDFIATMQVRSRRDEETVRLQEQELRRLMAELESRDKELSAMTASHQEQMKSWVR